MVSNSETAQSSTLQDGSSTKNIFKTFARHSSIKLGDSNFLPWKQQVEGIIWVQKLKLHLHLVNPGIPIQYLIIEDRPSETENPVYLTWQQEDPLLFTWLLSALSIQSFLIRWVHADEVWTALDQYQKTQINVKSRWLLSVLKSIMDCCYILLRRQNPCSLLHSLMLIGELTQMIGSPHQGLVSILDQILFLGGLRNKPWRPDLVLKLSTEVWPTHQQRFLDSNLF